MPSLRALSSFEPGAAPATTSVVRPETESVTVPPRRSMRGFRLVAAEAGERPRQDEDPPGERPALLRRRPVRAAIVTPAASSRRRSFEVLGLPEEEHDAFGDDGADVLDLEQVLLGRPRRGRAMSGKRSASVRASFSPTCRMPRPKRRRAGSSFALDRSISATRLAALLAPIRSSPARSSARRRVEVRDRADEARGQELVDEGLAQALDVHRPAAGEMEERFAEPGRAGRILAARDGFVLRAGRPGCRRRGIASGMTKIRSRPVRRSVIGPTTLGMTSPLRSIRTRSPMRMSLRRISSSLWSVARLMSVPDSLTGSRTATGVSAPVRPTWTMMSSSRVVAWRAGNLKETAQRGNLAVTPELAPLGRVVDLEDDAVDVVIERVALLGPVPPVARRPSSRVRQSREWGFVLKPSALSFASVSHWLGVSGAVDGQGVEEDVELARRDLARIEEADRAGGGVARIGEERLLVALAVRLIAWKEANGR